MSEYACRRCGCNSSIRGFISIRCPICGDRIYMPDAPEKLLWSEHKNGLLLKRDGWTLMDIIEPPAWFLEHVV